MIPNTTLSYFGQFTHRSPSWPFKKIQEIQNKDLNVLFTELFLDPFFKEAIFLASPNLYNAFEKWINGAESDPKKVERLHISLLKYYLRMSNRCTPFGLFAGCGTGIIADLENESAAKTNEHSRHTRLDMNYLTALVNDISIDPEIRYELKYFPNNSIYENFDKVRFVEYEFINKRRNHNLVAVDNSEYLTTVLRFCKKGATIFELTTCLVSPEIDRDEAVEFINELITAQVLVSELEPTVTGEEFDKVLVKNLKTILGRVKNKALFSRLNNIVICLDKVLALLNQLDQNGTGNDVQDYISIMSQLESLGTKFEKEYIFQTDLVKSVGNNLVDKATADDVLEAINVLSYFTERHAPVTLSRFRDAFYERYEEREIKLVEALDTDIGIGYKTDALEQFDYTPFIEGFESAFKKPAKPAEFKMTPIQSFWLFKYLDAVKEGRDEIIIRQEDLTLLENKATELPATFSAMISLDKNEREKGHSIYFYNCGGSSAANLLGRFCHNDAAILNLVNEITEFEKQIYSGKLIAEIVHLPESRIGNILSRPVVREMEIPYLAKSTVDISEQIDINDLFISIKNERLILRSGKHNKEIIPRLSTAHNYEKNALPVYQFLCDLQLQNRLPSVYINLGVVNSLTTCTPRIRYKNAVLLPKTWNFAEKDLSGIKNCSPDKLFSKFSEFRSVHELPQYILMAEHDNELLLNLDDENSIKLFVTELKQKKTVRIIESFFKGQKVLLESNKKPFFTNQFIFSFKNNASVNVDWPVTGSVNNLIADRIFVPGDNWLYFKIYVSHKSTNRILTECIQPIIDNLLVVNKITKWFFLRYLDPKPHLKIRLHLQESAALGSIIAQLNSALQPYIESGLIWKIQLDSYEREIERYGLSNIENTEDIFFYDSQACMKIIANTSGITQVNDSWLIALKSIDGYLDSFSFTLQQKHVYMTEIRNGFLTEFDYSEKIKNVVNRKFKENEKRIFQIMTVSTGNKATDEILRKRDAKIQSALVKLKNSVDKRQSYIILQSYLHMFLNRFFTSKQRLHEFVVYCMLEKYYFINLQKYKSINKSIPA
ncbi:lantibiotic dehydratase [Mucilaginibacter sp.]|uniref:lantibiotic dehydratase n=1 Tax=Mucilaginibacter sp. TaxID=1882438 RepID=UPI0025E821D4|nr:lantibiotic dehydratase [Mucilaginibacter sp.]